MTATHEELEAAYGRRIGAKVVMVLVGGHIWHRAETGVWERYPPYPENPISKLS